MAQFLDTYPRVTAVLIAQISQTKLSRWVGGSLTMNCETIGKTFTREEGRKLFVRWIKLPRGVTGHSFKGN